MGEKQKAIYNFKDIFEEIKKQLEHFDVECF